MTVSSSTVSQTMAQAVRKHIARPYYEQIEGGGKTVEGRVCRDFWGTVNVGQLINFWTNDDLAGYLVEVVALHKAKDFGELYTKFGHQLLPGVETAEDATTVYRKWFSDQEVATHGVVGVELRVVV